EADGTTVLYIGAENWPIPVPLVSKDGQWHFDGDSGAREILFRRVGENESYAIEICRALVSSSNELGAIMPVQPVPLGSVHGYYFQHLTASDPRRDASNKTEVGPLFVAYPAEYRLSGVMTFVVTGDGTVFEKDLGAGTTKMAKASSSGNLDL